MKKLNELQSYLTRLRGLMLTLIILCSIGSGNVWGAAEIVYTLDGTTTGGSAGYDVASDIEQDEISWKVTGNTTMDPWRLGGKGGSKNSATSNLTRTIYNTDPIAEDVTSIEIKTGTSTLNALTNINVKVTTGSNGSGTVKQTFTETLQASHTYTFDKPAGQDWSDCYYLITFTFQAKGKTNQYIQFLSADFYAEASTCEKIGAPTVTATPGDRQIVLEWAKQAEASSYTVTCPGGTVGTITGTTTKSCTITSLTNGTSYTWTVTPVGDGSTYCSSGNTAASASATPNVYRTITYYDKDGSHTTSLADGTNIATALNALYGVGGPTSCDAVNYGYFVGWKVGEISGTASSVTLLDDEVVNASSPSNNYYAVWSDTDPSAGGWTKVTSIAVGDVVVFAYDDDYKEMTGVTTSGTTYGSAAAVDPYPDDLSGDYALTVEAGNGGTGYSFKHGSVYLSWSSGNSLTTSGTKADASSWTISESSSGNFKFANVGTTSRILQYNSGSPRWACYGNSGQSAFQIYKQSAGGDAEYITTCCTALGTINGSNLSTSSTGTSVSVEVLTAGVNAYGDANNVSGYDFKLYTASAGGSAAASYSSNSKAGTSHTFTGLDPLTDYWVTIRPIGDGSTYCNTTEESSRVLIATTCTAPNHVDIAGAWDRFAGETISLTATAYSSAGTGSPIDAGDITGYQWYKGGTAEGNKIAGATSATYTKNNCTIADAGDYYCKISTGATCSTMSSSFGVKVYALDCYTGGAVTHNFTRVGETQTGTLQLTLTASTGYAFKVRQGSVYLGNSGTINEDENTWEFTTSGNNVTVNSGLGGTFTFTLDYSSNADEPILAVTYPRTTIYLVPNSDWLSNNAKFAYYYYGASGGNGWTDFIAANECGMAAEIPQWNGITVIAVRFNPSDATPGWNGEGHVWNQTDDIALTAGNNLITITGWNNSQTYMAYSVPTYTISYAKGSTTYTGGNTISGSKDSETKTCGVDFTLPSSAVFSATGYTQTGWTTSDGGSKTHNLGGDYTTNAAQAFYPAWTVNTHTLTWSANGGDALTGDYTSGTVAYGTSITAPNTPTRTGYSFDGWHNGSSIVTPATTMPDNDLTYTAQWSLATYTVTLNTNGGTINAGNVTSYTYGTGATLPTNVTRDGYRFDGWFSDDGVWSDQVTAISTTATGDKTYYAKWTAVYTVTWSVNGETSTEQVVSGEKVASLPTAPTSSDCDDSKVFVGWRATAIDGTSVSDPGGIFTTKDGSPTISANTIFYAVFADESGGDITLVTNVSELTNGTQVYIYSESADVPAFTAVMKAYESGNNVKAVSGSVSSNKLTPSEGACAYTIGTAVYSETNGYTFNDGSHYLRATGSNKNYLVGAAELGDDGYGVFSISITDGVFSISSIGNTSRGVMQFNRNGDTGEYDKALFACYASASQRNVQLFKKNPLVYANYVTSCSSCDADATFTNTTPAVSEIDCTSATLTATGGLATVGADGCHVSDYGFVIGTSDNPAIGGSGVTKLQVGTSDPTIGEDFSYDATGLTKGTHYYIRAYAINRHGTAYSSSTNFWTNNVSSIAITTAPTKTNYIVGETFDATGMVVTATMASSATEDVTSDVTYSDAALTAGTSQNFAINYTLCETAKSVNQVINVYTLTVTEGANPSYGTATNSSANIVSITGLGDHKTYTVTVTSSNATAVDNGDNTWSIINPTGNVTVTVDYADAVQVKVYYKVDGVTVTGLTQDVYQSETTTLPTASELATAMTAQSMDIPDDDYPNFYGWSETEFPAQTAEPTIVTGTPTINAEKTYYAVYSNINKKSIKPSDFAGSYATNEGEKTIDDEKYQIHDICLQSSQIQFKSTPGYLYTKEALAYIKKIEITGLDLVVNACSDNAGTLDGDAITPTGSDTYVYTFPASKQYFKIKGKGGTDKVSLIEIFYANSTVYYMTQFCATKVVLTHNSPEHGSVEFSRSSIATCGSDKNVSLTITPDAGYKLTGWTVNTSSGYADAKTTSPAVVTTNNNSAAQNITLTFAEDANKDYDVTATFGLMTVESWAWTVNSAAIPDPLNLYVGQSARLDVAYTPAGVDACKKTYTRTKVDAYINWVGVLNANYTTISGKASTGESTTEVTFTHADGPSTTVNVKVLPLPLVHFGDIVHNVSFDDVVATLSDNTLSPTKTTPTHADFDGSTANTCEEQHLHLVGWIREDWPALVTYLNGGAQPSTDDITGAGNDGSGNAYFFTPGASINTQTFNGVTFYAVWAKVE